MAHADRISYHEDVTDQCSFRECKSMRELAI
jgi:hypothetical protein